MAIIRGPKIIKTGLILALDAADINSYIGSGTNWRDMSANDNNGALTNSPTFNSSNGGSIVFNGTNQYIVVNSSASILPTTAYTKIAWFYVTSFATSNNIIAGNNGQHTMWLAAGTKLNAGHNGSWSTVVSNTALSLNNWYCGAVTFNTTTGWVLYLNGISESTNISTTTFTGNGDVLLASYTLGANLFTGRIACGLVYNRVLTATEILQNYNATKSRFGL